MLNWKQIPNSISEDKGLFSIETCRVNTLCINMKLCRKMHNPYVKPIKSSKYQQFEICPKVMEDAMTIT